MTLREIVRNRKGRAGAWRIERRDGGYALIHYAHTMVEWTDRPETTVTALYTGWGSVSDQQGVNKAMSELDAPYYYSRAGGAHYVEVVHQDAAPVDAELLRAA